MPKRTPMKASQKRAWVEQKTWVVMGVDPGMASVGVAILGKTESSPPICYKLALLETKKADKKDRRGLRVSADDSRRLREIWSGLADVASEYAPQSLAFEVYQPYRAQGGSAWKAARVEGAIQMFGLERGMLVLPFLPQDLKRAFCGGLVGTKNDVEVALSGKVERLGDELKRFPKTKREHLADAAGHAYLAFEEMIRMRAMLGY
jgi:Holliday junction resolvasome RuvABC endonuclease subunit